MKPSKQLLEAQLQAEMSAASSKALAFSHCGEFEKEVVIVRILWRKTEQTEHKHLKRKRSNVFSVFSVDVNRMGQEIKDHKLQKGKIKIKH